MKKIFLFIVIIMTISCSSDEEKSKIKEITVLSSKKVRIGDTIVLSGKDMSNYVSVKFKSRGPDLYYDTFNRTDESVSVVVPSWLRDEKFSLLLIPNNQKGHSPLDFNLIGTFELPKLPQIVQGTYNFLSSPQMIDENIFLIRVGDKILKSIDGGYNWNALKQFDGYIGAMYFLNENVGWVVSSDASTSTHVLYFTNDGGSTFNEIYTLDATNLAITDIHFSTENNGYLLTSNGKIYKTTDNSNFELAYTFPNSEPDGNNLGFKELSVYNDNLLVSRSDNYSESGFIRKINTNYDYIFHPQSISKSQLVGNLQAYFLVYVEGFGSKLFYSNNLDSNWEETSDKTFYNFHFFNKDKGIGIAKKVDSVNDFIIYETSDGGKNWTNKIPLGDNSFTKSIVSHNNVALIIGSNNQVWKHIYE